jgi:hypothetical protein
MTLGLVSVTYVRLVQGFLINSKAVATLANLINGYFPPKLYTRKSNRFKKFFLIK